MNLHMIRPKNNTEYLILLKTKNCEKIIEQTKTKPQKTGIYFFQTKEFFQFRTPINLIADGSWIILISESTSIQFYFYCYRIEQKFRTLDKLI